MVRRFLIVCAVLLLAGCANGYERFYRPLPSYQTSGFAPVTGEPQLVWGDSDPKITVLRMYEQGFAPVGIAAFVGPAANPNRALAQAKKVGAAIVAVNSTYQNTVSGAIPLVTPNTTTSYTNGTASAFGTGGFATGTYSGTTTTYGTQTTYIPYSIDRYQQAAIFFAPLNRRGPGVMFNQLTTAQRQQFGTNKGLIVVAVRTGSPAFMADILPGDIILSIGGHDVYDVASLSMATDATIGEKAAVTLLRNGIRISKTLFVPAGEW